MDGQTGRHADKAETETHTRWSSGTGSL